MSKRFWVGAALTLPIFFGGGTSCRAHRLIGDASRWMQFALGTPVVLWAGWPFFERGWQSLFIRNLNMFTLIAMGTGVAWVYSAVVMLAPGIFPPSFQHEERSASILKRPR